MRFSIDYVAYVGLILLVLAVHPVTEMVSHPFWRDEAWVALMTKANLSDLPWMTATVPLGFTGLLWIIPWPNGESLRLLPLAFSVGTALISYKFIKSIVPWRKTRASAIGFIAGVVVALAPTSLVRDDLKQYTADAFFAILILMLGLRLENKESVRSIYVFVPVTLVIVFISHVAALVALAVFAGLILAAGKRRQWQRVIHLGVSALVVFAAVTAYIQGFVAKNIRASVFYYWSPNYLEGSFLEIISQIWERLAITRGAGWGILWLPLAVIGLIALFRHNQWVVGTAMIILCLEMVLLASLKLYPFLDMRTSHFLLVLMSLFALIGAVSLSAWVWRRQVILGMFLATSLALVFVVSAVPYLGTLSIIDNDVRSQVSYVQEQMEAEDVVVVSRGAIYGVGYYWETEELEFVEPRNPRIVENYVVQIPGINAVNDRRTDAISDVLRTAVSDASASGGRVWIIRSHVVPVEEKNWAQVFEQQNIDPVTLEVGIEPLLVLNQPALKGDVEDTPTSSPG